MSDREGLHRREFVRACGVAGAVALGARRVPAQEAEEAKPEEGPSEAEARMELIEARYGEHLDGEARRAVRRGVEGVVRRGTRLRAFRLTNGDEPMPVFEAYRAPLR